MDMALEGMRKGAFKGIQKAAFLMQNGFTMDDVVNADFRPAEMPGGMVTNIVGRGLEAADQFFRSMRAETELYAQAYNAARNRKLQPGTPDWQEAVALFLANPPVKALAEIEREAKRSTFREDPGIIMKNLMKIRGDIVFTVKEGSFASVLLPSGKIIKIFNPTKFLVPFVQTPANIMKQSFEATPAGLVSSMFKETEREQSLAGGRALLGTALLAPLAYLVMQNAVSGSGPDDKELRDELYRMGWQPNSIRIGNTWYGYSNFQPLALPLSMMANAYETTIYAGTPPSFGSILAKTANSVLQSSYLSGLAALQDALDDPDRAGAAFINKTLNSLVPISSMRAQMARAVDPVVRQPETIGETIQSTTPTQTGKVRARLDAFGDEAKRSGNIVSRLLSPVNVSATKVTPLERELYRLKDSFQLGFPGKTMSIGGKSVGLTPDEYDQLVKSAGSEIKRRLTMQVESGGWSRLSDEQQVDIIERIVTSARSRARAELARTVRDRVRAGQ
jgi:hypothetical protein